MEPPRENALRRAGGLARVALGGLARVALRGLARVALRGLAFVALCGLACVARGGGRDGGSGAGERPAAPRRATILEAPAAGESPSTAAGRGVLISGRRITPIGRPARVQSYGWGLAISPDESKAVILSRDAWQVVGLDPPRVIERVPPHGEETPEGFREGTYMGCGFSPDGRTLWIGGANRGLVLGYDLEEHRERTRIPIDGDGWRDSFLGDFAITASGRELIGVDQHNFRLVRVDLAEGRVVQSVRVGRNPFAVRLSRDETRAWVSNVGMFVYPLLPGVRPGDRRSGGLEFPPYGFPSREAEEGVTIQGRRIPGLGSPNHPDAMSVFAVDLERGEVEAKIKTGWLVGARRGDLRTVGGASPSRFAVGRRWIYVADSTNDSVSVIDARDGEVAARIELLVEGLESLRGVLPFGLALAPDERRLYVACAGLDAVAVVDTSRRRLLGYLPAGWFTSFVRVTRDGRRLVVYSAKGYGSGPNGGRGFVAPARGLHPGDIMQGLLQVIDVPPDDELGPLTRRVVENTYREREVADDPSQPVPPAPGLRRSPIRHIVFIVKENRTFDQVYGDRPGVDGDPTLAELGRGATVRNEKTGEVVRDVLVTPNHQALADRFALLERFFCDSDQSNTGHRWVAGVYPNEWVEVNARSRIEERLFSSAPGRRYVAGASAVVLPEDYNEAGALWEHLDRHGISFFNFGFGTEMPASIETALERDTGVRMSVGFPLPRPLFERTSRRFPTFNMAIPDQYRVDIFAEDLEGRWQDGREPFPRLVTLVLPNDHMTDPRPEAGYPFEASYVADNDLALGRIVDLLSHTRWWPEMLIIVTEDDAQGGRDHVDAHRAPLLLISPWVKRGYVSRRTASFGSVMRLIFTLLDLPPLNQFDATATLVRDAFATSPDPRPYRARPVDRRLFDPERALKPFEHGFDWSALLDSPEMDDPEEMREAFRRRKPGREAQPPMSTPRSSSP